MMGACLIGRVPHGHWKTTTFVAALRHDAPPVRPGFAGGYAEARAALATLPRRNGSAWRRPAVGRPRAGALGSGLN